MKLIKWLFTIALVTLGVLYTALFTQFGNNILIPIVEQQAMKSTQIKDIKIVNFALSFTNFHTDILLDKQTISLKADFDIAKQIVNSSFIVNIKDLSRFNYITKQKLKGSFFTKGELKGTFDKLKLKGLAKVAKGNIDYKLDINKNNIHNIIVDIKSLDISTLLYMVNQPKYTSGKLNSKISISTLKKLKGVIKTTILDVTLDKKNIENYLNSPAKSSYKNILNTLLKTNQTLEKYIHKELTQEIFKTITIDTTLDNKIINNTLFMKSKHSTIKSKKLYTNLEKNYLDAIIDLNFYGYNLGLKLKGDINKPKIKFNISKLLNNKIKQKVKNKLNSFLKNKIKNKDLNNLINNLF